MKHDAMKLTSSYNNQLYIKVMNGHFATNHSHINQYIDMTTLKVRGTMAAAAAKSMGTEYVASTIVDTIVCMDGTEVIGAYLAETLSQNGITLILCVFPRPAPPSLLKPCAIKRKTFSSI